MKHTKTILYCLVTLLSLFSLSCTEDKTDAQLKQMAKEVNKICPKEVDYLTTLTSCEILPNRTIKYNYVVNINLVKTNSSEFMELTLENTLYNVLNNKSLDPIKKMGVTFCYNYVSTSGKQLGETIITPEEYNQATSRFSNNNLSDDEMVEELKKTTAFQNLQLPREIDNGVILSKVECGYPRYMNFIYVINDVDIKDVNIDEINVDEIKNSLALEIKNNPSDAILKDNDVVFKFTYCDKNSIEMYHVEITPSDYKNTRTNRIREIKH